VTTKNDYTQEEWEKVMTAPMTAGMIVVGADVSVLNMLIETKGMLDAIVKGDMPRSAAELIGAVRQEVQAQAEKREKPPIDVSSGKTAEEVQARLLGQLTDVAAILAAKSTPEEADGYKAWILSVAGATANAGREGGFLGIGSTRVSDQEKAAMAAIGGALGV
jgi:hypothetical protein